MENYVNDFKPKVILVWYNKQQIKWSKIFKIPVMTIAMA